MVSLETVTISKAEEHGVPNSVAWYSKDEVCRICNFSERTFWREIAAARDSQLRELPQSGRGRPEKLYHYSIFPQLMADWKLNRCDNPDPVPVPPVPEEPEVARKVSADDLALAQLRLQAVSDYEARMKFVREKTAVRDTCRDWAKKPRSLAVKIVEHLPGNHERNADRIITLGSFSPRTLQTWRALYKEKKDLLALAPRQKGIVGRKEVEIPEETFCFVYRLATSAPRANIKAVLDAIETAVETAKYHVPKEQWPNISLRTWQRRILAYDPRGAGSDLMHSVSKFRQFHSPDVSMDWDKIPYNGRWELDDVQQDWYAHATDIQKTLRPYAYAIIRVRTRQWIAVVTSECKITMAQIRIMVGTAMASKQGGIPDLIKFERGTTACDADLEHLLTTMGVRVSRTGMDDGASLPGMIADVGSGHFQGKGVVEANFRKMHNLAWDQVGEIGSDERNTAPARTENLRKLAEEKATKGEALILPRPEEWHLYILQLMEKHNNLPHSGLPETIDATTAEIRHMTPNEMAIALKDTPVKVMDEQMLPRFFAKGDRVKITRNGFTLNKIPYGRFDDELQQHKEVTAYATADCPYAYVAELGRSVSMYEKMDPNGDGEEQFGKKRHQEKQFRNKYEETVAKALLSGGTAMVESVAMTANPVPDRTVEIVTNEAILKQAEGIRAGRKRQTEAVQEQTNRFAPVTGTPENSAPVPNRMSRRRSLLSNADAIDDSLLSSRNTIRKEESCTSSELSPLS